nr:hypothetical protein [Tanacetum cinerariifolium]
PKLKASARKKKGDFASSTTPLTLTPITTVESAPRLSTTAKGESDEEETRQEEEESFDLIPRKPEESKDESNDEEDQELRLNSHVTLTPVNPDGPQKSSSVSSFVTSMLNPTSDVGVESIFMTVSSLIVSLQTPTPIMTPSTIATITTSSEAPIPPPTIPSIILENLPTFNSAFCFDERLRKDPPLDQTGGLKDKKKEVSMHQLVLHLKQQPRVQADLPQGLNLDNCLPGRKHQQFYGYAINRESSLDVYSKRRIITVTELNIMEWHDYKHLD